MGESFTTKLAALRRSAAVLATLAATSLGGCAVNDTGASEVWDPIETPNRFIFSINRTIDMIALRPLAVSYRDWMPEGGKRGVRNMLHNLGEPVTAVNEAIQGNGSRAGKTMIRFVVNSTIGVAGMFDVAAQMGIPPTTEGFGNTVGYYAGVQPENGGFYMMLPIIGPSNARDAAGLMMDYAIDPFGILTFSLDRANWLAWAAGRYVPDAIDTRSRTLYALDDLEKNSVDYYAALRSAYTQQRAELIRQKRQKVDAKAELERRDNLALVR
ncbi:MAG: VacJ family lipoprotein [Alphaproteobacteria bacterium]|nr:VacJ family lipoprotein [Alphaproteobacteria bacterium]